MGKDAFDHERYGCTKCACSDYICQLDAMPEAERDALENSRNILTCQRKSELVLTCACGHASWNHAQTPEGAAIAARSRDHGAFEADELKTLLRSIELLHLRELLGGFTLSDCLELLGSGRVRFLSALQAAGVSAMKDRQAIANACGKVRREASSLFGRVDGECECFDDASFPLVWPFSQAELRRGSATSGSSPLSPHSEDVSAAALAAYYREALRAPGALELGSLLDVGASSSRLLPVDLGLFFRVTRTGADASELEVDPTPRERALAEHDESPTLPYGDGAFDAVLCEGVIGGLCSPREVVAEWHRVLRPGGHVHASFSRSLPNATELWFAADDQGRKRYVASIFHFSPRAGWRDITVVQLSEPGEGTDGSYVLRACKT